MKRLRPNRRLRTLDAVIAIAVALAFAAVVVAGLHRASVAQAEAAISLDDPVSFPVDI